MQKMRKYINCISQICKKIAVKIWKSLYVAYFAFHALFTLLLLVRGMVVQVQVPCSLIRLGAQASLLWSWASLVEICSIQKECSRPSKLQGYPIRPSEEKKIEQYSEVSDLLKRVFEFVINSCFGLAGQNRPCCCCQWVCFQAPVLPEQALNESV